MNRSRNPRTPANAMPPKKKASPKTVSPAWDPKSGMQGGQFKTSSEVIAEAEKPSPIYEARKAANATAKPSMTTPVSRAAAVQPPTVAPRTKPVITMPSMPPDKPEVQPQSSPSRGALVSANASKGLPAARTAESVRLANAGLPEMGPPKSAMNAPDNEVLTNEDMSGKGYTLIGGKSGVKKWRKGAEMDAANKAAADQTMANIIKSPMYRGRAGAPQAPKPLETENRMVNNRPTIVQTGGDTTPEFEKLKAAQAKNAAGTGTKEDDDLVAASVGGDVLGRQPGQIAQLRADEKAGKFQAGRRVRG